MPCLVGLLVSRVVEREGVWRQMDREERDEQRRLAGGGGERRVCVYVSACMHTCIYDGQRGVGKEKGKRGT